MIITLVIVFGVAPYAEAGVIDPDLRSTLRALDPDDEVAVIVTLTDQVDVKKIKDTDRSKRSNKIIAALKSRGDSTQTSLKIFLKSKKARRMISFWIFNGMAATVRADAVAGLAGQPAVAEVRLDETLTMADPVPSVSAQPQWNLSAIRSPELWAAGFTGTGVVIASVDTGVDIAHPDVAGKWRGGSNSWYDPNGQHLTPYDYSGHGTQTVGIMVGGEASGTAIGVAPGAQWIAAKIFNDSGTALFSNIHLVYQWLLDPDGNPLTSDAPDIVNNSWGLSDNVDSCIPEFQADLEALKAAGIAVVFAAGNAGPSGYSSISPANYPSSVAVGSVDASLAVAYTSSRGPSACDGGLFPQLVAPGVNIKTTGLTFGGVFPNSYTQVSGTSFAAPHVAGSMALLLSAFPQISVTDLETALTQSALPLDPSTPNNDSGYGLVDVAEAYLYLYSPPVCTDADNDGFYTAAECGEPVDCNDGDQSVFPGAAETKHDGIDQDCNGYDLTIDKVKAMYNARRDSLYVVAFSDLRGKAALELAGFGPMQWHKKTKIWSLFIKKAGGNPGTVEVAGVEGTETAETKCLFCRPQPPFTRP